MLVMDIYKAVCLEKPDIETVRFFEYLNEAVRMLQNRFSGLQQKALSELDEEMTIGLYYQTAMIKYILARLAQEYNAYSLYMKEFELDAERARRAGRRDKKKGARIYAPRGFQ